MAQLADRSKRITLLIDSMGGGGAERMYLHLATALVARGHQVDLLLLKPRGQLLEKIPASIRTFALRPAIWDSLWQRLFSTQNCIPSSLHIRFFGPCWIGRWIAWLRVMPAWPYKRLGLLSTWLAMISIGIADYLRSERPTVVLAGLYHSEVGALLAKQVSKSQTDIVISVRNVISRQAKRHLSVVRLLFPKASGIVAISKGVAENLTTDVTIASNRITVIYNPVITSEFETLAQEKPDHPWMTVEELPVILACGRLVPQKDYPTLLRAFAHLENEHIRLVILGQGELEMALKALSCELGIAQRVSFAGWVSNPLAFMSRARLFVFSSRWEGLGNVLIEAMWCGCPVVSTDCVAGPREILEDGRWGELVAVGDDQALAQAIERALAQDPDREALRRRASFFSIDRAVDQYEKVLLKKEHHVTHHV